MPDHTRTELLKELERAVRRFIAAAMLFNLEMAAKLGLNGTDLQCLNLIEMQGSVKPGDLARMTSMTTGGITVVLDRLEKAGYIKRQPNPEDRRSSIVRFAPARARKLGALYREKAKGLEATLSKYDDRELRLILGFLNGEAPQ